VFHWQQQLLLLPVFSAGNPKTTKEIYLRKYGEIISVNPECEKTC
jgi:hypothetical protein